MKTRIVFRKYHTLDDVKKSMLRATELTLVLYEIKELFARNYLHKENELIFNSFLRDVIKVNGILKKHFDYEWLKSIHKVTRPLYYRGLLHRCVVFLKKTIKNRVKFWKMCQENRDLFKVL